MVVHSVGFLNTLLDDSCNLIFLDWVEYNNLSNVLEDWGWTVIDWAVCKKYEVFYSGFCLSPAQLLNSLDASVWCMHWCMHFLRLQFWLKMSSKYTGLGPAWYALTCRCQTCCSCVLRARTLTLFPDLSAMHLRQNMKYSSFRVRI